MSDPGERERIINRRISIAPMMDWTDKHCRYLFRLLTKNALLYSEMVVAKAVCHAGPERFLSFNQEEHPIALQLGGSVADELARCAKLGEQYGYDEINLNIGCPSDRVQSGRFGVCLMKEPQLVADCVAAMRAVVAIPVTVKTRIGVDDQDSYQALHQFIETVARTGCETFIIHARKAWLQGLSPKQNRDIPPLQYQRVYQLKRDFPDLEIIINGGISDYDSIHQHLHNVDGVMIGRKAYQAPYFLSEIDQHFYACSTKQVTAVEILQQYSHYVQRQLDRGVPLASLLRHLMGFFRGVPKGKQWRRYLSEHIHQKNAGIDVLLSAIELMH
ncbi:MAG: tRNA dihydrouridine(20/20a) synthase DusA [Pseudomonadota bacterium]